MYPSENEVAGPKENPAGASAGLPKDSDQADTITGKGFNDAFRLIVQAQLTVRDLIVWSDDCFNDHQKLSQGQRETLRRDLREGWAILRGAYSVEVRDRFESLMGIDCRKFEQTLKALEEKLGEPS